MYLHTHLHDLPDGEIAKRGNSETVRTAIGVFSDIDCVGPGRKKPAPTLCGSFNDAVWIVEQFTDRYRPLQPSLVIRSGYGAYAGLLFREPMVIEGPEDRKQLERLSRQFHTALDEIATNRGWTGAVDYCDVAKILRFPGVVNWKDPSNPRPVTLLWDKPARFDPSEIAEILPVPWVPGSSRHGLETSRPEISNLIIVPNVEIPPMLLEGLRVNHPKFGPTWDNSRTDLKDQSCSGYDLALASIGVSCSLTDQQIADLMIAHRREFPREKKIREGRACAIYMQTTIATARAGRQSSESASKEFAELERLLNMQNAEPAAGSAGLAANVLAAPAGEIGQEHHPVPPETPSSMGIKSDAEPPFGKFDSLCESDRKFRAAWDHRRQDLKDQSQEHYDQALADIAATAQWTTDEITALIIANRRKHGVDAVLDERYYEQVVNQAMQNAQPIILDQQITKLMASNSTIELQDEDGGQVAVVQQNKQGAPIATQTTTPSTETRQPHKTESERRAILDLLSKRFNVPMRRIVRYIGGPSFYRLETEFGDVQLGTVAGLITQSKLRLAIADATGRYLPQLDPDVWPTVAQALLDACESVDRGQDATLHGTMSEWLGAYLAERSVHATLEEADEGREPFMDDGSVVMFSRDFRKWLQIRQNERVNQGRLTADLRAFGAEPDVYKAVIKGKQTTRSAWRLPHGPWIPDADKS